MRELVGRYGYYNPQITGYACKGWVRHWEVFSEMYLGKIKDSISPQEYFQIIKLSYRIIKDIDPTAIVLMGALDNTSNWFDEFLSLGGGEYFDKMNLHIYRMPNRAAQIVGWVDEQMKSHGVNKPIWVSEINLGPQNYLERDKQDLCPQPDDTDESLSYIGQYFTALAEVGTERIFYLPLFCHYWGPGFLELCSEMPKDYCQSRNDCVGRGACSDHLIVRQKSFQAFKKAVGVNPCAAPDIDCDGRVDIFDYNLLVAGFGK